MKHLIKINDELIISLLALKNVEHTYDKIYNTHNIYLEWNDGTREILCNEKAKIFWEEFNKMLEKDDDKLFDMIMKLQDKQMELLDRYDKLFKKYSELVKNKSKE